MNEFAKDLCNGVHALLTMAMASPSLSEADLSELLYEIIADCDIKLDMLNGRLAESGSS